MKGMIIIILVLASWPLALADKHTINYADAALYDPQSSTYNPSLYQQQSSYSNPDFLRTSDPGQWNLNLVTDWSTDATVWKNQNIAQVLTKAEFYQVFNAEKAKYSDLPEELWKDSNFNHRRVDPGKYLRDLGCSACRFAGQPKEYIRYTKTGITHAQGQFASVQTYPPHTQFEVTKEGIVAKIHSGSAVEMPETDFLKIEGTGITVDGVLLDSAKIKYISHVPYLERGDELTVGGTRFLAGKKTTVYFDGLAHAEDNYLSLDLEKGKMLGRAASGNSISLELKPGSRFADVQKNDAVHLIWSDGEAELINRNKGGLIPLLQTAANRVVLTNNGKIIKLEKVEVLYQFISDPQLAKRESAPLQLQLMDKASEKMLGENAIYFDDYKNFAILPEQDQKASCRGCELDFRARIFSDAARAGIKQRFGVTVQGGDSNMVSQLYLNLQRLAEAVASSPSKIVIAPLELQQQKCGKAGACTFPDGTIYLKETSQDHILHEAAHTLHMGNHKMMNQFERAALNPDGSSVYGSKALLGTKTIGEQRNEGGELIHAGHSSWTWADGKIEPRHGCILAYGCNRVAEDIATFTSQAVSKPEQFRPLVDPDSPQYDSRYERKLGILRQYGFLTQQQYERIFPPGGFQP